MERKKRIKTMNKTKVIDELFEADDVLREEALEQEALKNLGWCE